MEVEEIIKLYQDSAINYGIASDKLEDSKVINKYHDVIIECFLSLQKKGENALLQLKTLTSHKDSNVVLWAATHLLSVDEGYAREIIQRLIDNDFLIGFDAKMILKEWDKGRLNFEYNGYSPIA